MPSCSRTPVHLHTCSCECFAVWLAKFTPPLSCLQCVNNPVHCQPLCSKSHLKLPLRQAHITSRLLLPMGNTMCILNNMGGHTSWSTQLATCGLCSRNSCSYAGTLHIGIELGPDMYTEGIESYFSEILSTSVLLLIFLLPKSHSSM